MISYNRYIAYNRDQFIEGDYKHIIKNAHISRSSIQSHCGKPHAVKGWKIAKSFKVVYQLLDAETGDVIMEGRAPDMARKLNAGKTYITRLVNHPTTQYNARVVYKPTPEYLEIVRRFGREI